MSRSLQDANHQDRINRALIHIFLTMYKAWHSTKQDVYHVNADCYAGDDMSIGNIRRGPGKGRDLCEICENLKKSKP